MLETSVEKRAHMRAVDADLGNSDQLVPYYKQRLKSSLTCFLLRERKCIVSLPAVAVGLKGDGEARGVLPFCNTHASMVKHESGGSAF